MQFQKIQRMRNSTLASPAARLLRKQVVHQQKDGQQKTQQQNLQQAQQQTNPASDNVTAAFQKATNTGVNISVSSLKPHPPKSQFISFTNPLSRQFEGLLNLHSHASTCITLMVLYVAKNKRVYSRENIRMVLRTVQDLKLIIPAIPYLALPFKKYTLPAVFLLIPGLVPTSYYTQEVMQIKASTIERKREKSASTVVSTISTQLDKLTAKNNVLTAAGITALKRLVVTKMQMLNTSSITSADLIPLLHSVFIARLTASNSLESPSTLTRFLNFTFPFVAPRTRMIQWADWIIKDDALLLREGVNHLNWFELIEALEERGFTQLDGIDETRMRAMLIAHARFTKTLMDVVVSKRVVVDETVESANVAEKVSKHLRLTSEEIGGIATLLVFSRALNVNT
ncbi:hypothetical protein HK100_002191 [Physocladia obscura]|uniref:Letm1 RBD domain-containing protein n=1 Tax=Physocladia obscura TaxID=109957 RepID=A0AAD5XHJ7_9FUNG|nr:hypothetical protein HK100_002191 [Physocladia obscura]